MIANAESWPAIWEMIENEMQESSEKNVAVIFSVQEVETVCAVKMMQVGLRTRGITYSQYPIRNHSDLERTLAVLLSDTTDYRTVVLLNCGAASYVPAMAPPSAAEWVRYVVVDSHRPLDVRYNDPQDSDAVLLLADDDPLPLADIPGPPFDLDDLTPDQIEQIVSDAQAEQEAEEEAAADSQDSSAKRQRLGEGGESSTRICRDKLRIMRDRQRVMSHYLDMGSSYGKPSPLVLLPLAELLLTRADNSLLWPAAVGLTDQWVHQRISHQHHAAWYRQLADAVKASDANYAAQQQQQQQQQHRHGGRGSDQLRGGGDSGSSRQPISQAKLVAAQDYRLMLFRHWTLYDAFCFSPYVAPRLQTWRPGGKEAVALLFANMGVSLEQAKTEYNSMQSRSQRLFAAQLEGALLKTSLSHRELAADGFQLHHSRKVTAASDVVHACTALLSEYTVSDVADSSEPALGFWNALEALDCHTQSGWLKLLRGIKDAKMLQQAIIMDGGNMVTDQKLKVNPSARLQELNLAALAPTNAAEFRHPLTLLRLAHFVRDATKIARQGGGLRCYNYPIMVVGPEDGAGWCIVIGLRASVLADNAQFNIFGRTFEAVLSSPDSEVSWDQSRRGFDASVVYIHKDSLVTFTADVRAELIANAAADAAAAAAKQSQQQQQQQDGSDAAADVDAADDRQRWPRGSGGNVSGSGGADADAAAGDAAASSGSAESVPATDELADSMEEEVVAGSDDEQEQQQQQEEEQGGGSGDDGAAAAAGGGGGGGGTA